MPLDRALVRQVRAMDPYDLRRLMILARGLLLHADEVVEPTGVEVAGATITYRQEAVRCGKRGCTTCPHGPYWYGYWKQDGRTRKQYIGAHLPGQPLHAVHPEGSGSAPPEPGPASA